MWIFLSAARESRATLEETRFTLKTRLFRLHMPFRRRNFYHWLAYEEVVLQQVAETRIGGRIVDT